MTGFNPVGKISDLQPGQMKWVVVDRERVLLVNVEGTYYALKDQCGHQRAPLSRGKLQGHIVECPLHFACYDARTGRLLSGPVAVDVPMYEIRIARDTVYVKGGSSHQ
jgi:nitrite reductase/ring-hydroxylating ferredoxin subunit